MRPRYSTRVDDYTRLLHMRDAAGDAARFVRSHERSELDANRWLGLTKWIEMVGEAATRVTPEFRQSHPEIAWSRIAGMRHRLVHDYYEINYDIVWETAIRDLPRLVEQLDRLLADWVEEPRP